MYRLHQFLSPSLMLTLYKGHFRSCKDYSSHAGEGHPRGPPGHNRVISSPPLTESLLPLKFRNNAASLATFNHYCHAFHFSEPFNVNITYFIQFLILLPLRYSSCLCSVKFIFLWIVYFAVLREHIYFSLIECTGLGDVIIAMWNLYILRRQK